MASVGGLGYAVRRSSVRDTDDITLMQNKIRPTLIKVQVRAHDGGGMGAMRREPCR